MSFQIALLDSGKSWYYLTIYDQFQECGIFITISETVKEKMNCRFNINAEVTYKINWVLETMFKLMLSQVL